MSSRVEITSLSQPLARRIAGISAHRPPPTKPKHDDQRHAQRLRQLRKGQRAPGRQPCAHVQLALAADVDQPDARRQQDGAGAQHQRDHLDHDLGQAIAAAQRAAQDVAVGAQRVLAKEQQHDGKDDQRQPQHRQVAQQGYQP